MRVVVMTDIEGAAGVVSFEDQADAEGRGHGQAKKLLTGEVNAAVEGFLEAGATEILILDGHGGGAISFEDLHPAARLLHGKPQTWRDPSNPLVSQYDVAAMVGMHAMAGTADGVLHHTMSRKTVEGYTLNGKPIGEIAIFALYCGAFGVPAILVTGDDAACREGCELIPELTTASVKKGLNRTCAISLPPAAARQAVRDGARLALASHKVKPVPPLRWPGPFVFVKRYLAADIAKNYAANANATVKDALTVELRSDRIEEIIYA